MINVASLDGGQSLGHDAELRGIREGMWICGRIGNGVFNPSLLSDSGLRDRSFNFPLCWNSLRWNAARRLRRELRGDNPAMITMTLIQSGLYHGCLAFVPVISYQGERTRGSFSDQDDRSVVSLLLRTRSPSGPYLKIVSTGKRQRGSFPSGPMASEICPRSFGHSNRLLVSLSLSQPW